MTDEKKSAAELFREARALQAQARAAEATENAAANEPDRAQALRDAITAADDPSKRSAYAREKHRNSSAYKAAKEHATEVLGEVRETVVQMRRAGVDALDDSDRADLIKRVGEGVSARMAEKLRKAAAEMLDAAPSGDINRVDEIRRAAVVRAADQAPFAFERPDTGSERETADIVAAIPRQ